MSTAPVSDNTKNASGRTQPVPSAAGRARAVTTTLRPLAKKNSATHMPQSDEPCGSWKELLGRYRLAHAIPGRMRLRPLRSAGKVQPVAQLEGAIAFLEKALPKAVVSVSSGTGSILVVYGAGHCAASGNKLALFAEAVGEVSALCPTGKKSVAVQEEESARNPIPGKIINFFMPRIVVSALAVFRSIPHILKGIKEVFKGKLGLDVLDGSALLVCLLQRDFRSLSSITFFFALGEFLADQTRKKSRASLVESLALNIDQVWVRRGEVEMAIPLAELEVGEQVVVRAGSALPVDGVVVEGEGMVNQSTMTGESMPVPRAAGSSVFAGTVLEEGELFIQATKVGSDTRINAIVRSIEDSEAVKAAVQGRYERIADAIVPYNFLLSGAVYAATRNPMRAGSVLLVDYSCAIRLATPLSIFTGMREAAAAGVLIKGGKFMEAVCEADVFVFDKTGTLTNARPEVVGVIPFGGRKEDDILRLAACLEEHFVHPVGQAVVRASDAKGLKHREEHAKVEFLVAHGIASMWRDRRVLIGSAHFVLEDEKTPVSAEQRAIMDKEAEKGRSLLYLSIGGELAGLILIEDHIRDDASLIVHALKADGVKRVIMLTGDSEKTAASIAHRAGVDEYRSGLLPEDKAKYIEELRSQGYTVAMVGDGVNDSPALSAANVGIAMAEGADMAREVADIVLVSGKLEGLILARLISRESLRRIRTGFKTSLFWNSIFLMGGLMGFLAPGISALLHNATTAAIAVSSVRPMLGAPDGPAE